ncbi:hypothetical protein ABEW00_06230 [Rossellomorea vietnamensis]|uniref:hypothetical protein n=1 Tax=Rossellomorea vietnamensis TaxID=218284 RepID=UPI003D26D8D9
MNETSLKKVELSSLKLKTRHEYKIINEIENIRVEENHLIIEGFCFLKKVEPSRITRIHLLLIDQSSRSRKAYILKDVFQKTREDVTYLYGGKNDNYNYSGIKARININDLKVVKTYKEFEIQIMFEVDGRSILFPFSKLHNSLEKNKLPELGTIQVKKRKGFYLILNEQKVTSKKIERIKDQVYIKTKKYYQAMPRKIKTNTLKSTAIFLKQKFLR